MRPSLRTRIVLLAVSLALIAGAVATWNRSQPTTARNVPTAGQIDPAARRTPAPTPARTHAEQVPVQDASLRAPATAPRPLQVEIPQLRIKAEVDPVGVEGDGQMSLPEDPRRLGWYRYGASPGTPTGSAVLAGHVDSRRYGVGQLVRLQRVRPGARVMVTLSDGQQLEYRVVTVDQIRKAKLPLDQLFDRSGPPRLALVTCGGRYLPDVGGYEDNVVVMAVPTSYGAAGPPG